MLCQKIQLDDCAYLDTYVADQTVNYKRKAVLVIPGGGYRVVSERESEPVALGFCLMDSMLLFCTIRWTGRKPSQNN